jgi:AcrR family transcriptional regulator
VRSIKGRPATFTQAARRAQVIECAIEVIAEVGWAQTSIRKVADRVGVAMSAVLYHFGSKDNLVEAIIEQMYRVALAAIVPVVDAESGAVDKLNAHIRATVSYYDSHRTYLAALSQLASSYQPSDGRSFTELGLSSVSAEELAALDVSPILRAGQADGEFGDFPVDSAATALSGACNAVVLKLMQDPSFDAHRYGEDLVAMFSRIVQSTP